MTYRFTEGGKFLNVSISKHMWHEMRIKSYSMGKNVSEMTRELVNAFIEGRLKIVEKNIKGEIE